MSLRSTLYSPLCDTDIVAYREYLLAVRRHGYCGQERRPLGFDGGRIAGHICAGGAGALGAGSAGVGGFGDDGCGWLASCGDFSVCKDDAFIGRTCGGVDTQAAGVGVSCSRPALCVGGVGCAVDGGWCGLHRVEHESVVDTSSGLNVNEVEQCDVVLGKNAKKNKRKALKRKAKISGVRGKLGVEHVALPVIVSGENEVEKGEESLKKVVKENSVQDEVETCDSVPEWRRKSGRAFQGFFSECSDDVRRELRETRAKALAAKNQLDAEESRRRLAVLTAASLDDEVRKHSTGVRSSIERNMASMEKAHKTLLASDNVPGGFAETVVDSSVPSLQSGSISPNSSASMAEFHAVQKQNFDQAAEIEELKRKLVKTYEVTGFNPDFVDMVDKRTWTDTSENHAILDQIHVGDYVMDDTFAPDGKFHVRAV